MVLETLKTNGVMDRKNHVFDEHKNRFNKSNSMNTK